MDLQNVITHFKRPEYTGENRCLPCTVVNVVLAVVFAVAIAILVELSVGVVVFVAAIAIVYIRGYLVPGTPTLTRRYLPARVLRMFGKKPVQSSVSAVVDSTDSTDHSNADNSLVAAGVLARTGDDVDITSTFHERWAARAHEVVEDTIRNAAVRDAFGATDVSRTGDLSYVLDGNTSVRWGSTAALAGDIAAAEILEDELGGWTAPVDRRRDVFLGLRLCLEDCPACGGHVSVSEERVDPCCQKPHHVAEAVCTSCGAPLADAAVVDRGTDEAVRTRLLDR